MVTRKAQVTVEFLFAIVFILFVFLLLLGFVFQRKLELVDTKDFLDKKAECLRIASLISSVYSSGDGTSANIKTDYLITIHNYSRIEVESKLNDNVTKENVTCSFPIETLSYQLTDNLVIRNEEGDVVINEI